jgi:hypothetical protein
MMKILNHSPKHLRRTIRDRIPLMNIQPRIELAVALGSLLVALLFSTSCDSASSPHRPPRQVCTGQLLQIGFAKQTWALEHNKTTNDTPVESDLFGTNADIWQKVSCPAGGVYQFGRVGEKPTCSVPGHTL